MSTADRAGFENAINDYQNRLSSIKADELQAYAKRVAESDKPLEELKEVVGEITSPLALDFLKEGIMHHMGVASAQIKKGGAALRKDLEKQFNDRLGQLKERAQGILDEQRGRLQGALDEARGRAQGALDEARGNATEAFANARDQANALDPTNTNPNATNDEQGDDAQQRVADDDDEDVRGSDEEEEDEEPTGFEGLGDDDDEEEFGFPDEDDVEAPTSTDISALQSKEDVKSASDALKARFDNLTDEAQARVQQKYDDDPNTVSRGEGEGPNGERTVEDIKTNLNTMQKNIVTEEQAGNIKPPTAPQVAEGESDVQPATRAVTADAPDDDDLPTSLQEPTPLQGSVQQRIAQIEEQGDQLRATQQLPTGPQRPQGQGQDQAQVEVRPPGEDEDVRGFEDVQDERTEGDQRTGAPDDDEVVEGFGDDADAAAETGASAGRGALGALGEGAGEGLEGAEGALLASGAETGGLGFIAAGVLGIGAALASIFAPHHDPKPPPTPLTNVSAPTQTVGLR